jgi:Uma2 family endonuclease
MNSDIIKPVSVVARSVESATAEISARPFSADEFERMIEMGVIGEGDRCELIDGEIITMAALGSRHIACVNRLVSRLVPLVEPMAIVSPQNAIRLDDRTELVPDLVLLRMREDYYEGELGKPDDVLLLVEVSDTTLNYDRTHKIPAYARNGVPEVWLVNLPDDIVEVYTQPIEVLYRSSTRARRGDSLTPSRLPSVTLQVSDILGKARS